MGERRVRSAAAVAVVLALGALAACSGGDDDEDSSSGQSRSATTQEVDDSPGSANPEVSGSASTGEPAPVAEGDAACAAEVQVTGSVEESWTDEAATVTYAADGSPTTYQSVGGDYLLSLTAAGSGFDASAILTGGDGTSYGATPEDNLDIDPAGSGADIDVELLAPELPDETVAVLATFTCE